MRVLTSGGFDPLHPGHIESFRQAKMLAKDVHLIVALNSDDWLIRKKGFRFMDYETRAAVLRAIKYVDEVVPFDDSDGTACDALRQYRPEAFAKGGDRIVGNIPEMDVAEELGITVVSGLGQKINSSSTIFNGILPEVQRKWGTYRVIYNDGKFQVKILNVDKDKVTSLQRHSRRDEIFINLSKVEALGMGAVVAAPRGVWHQLAGRDGSSMYLELQYGPEVDEEDIERK